jgi:uncharacterized protein (DUF1810 family)
MRWLRNLNEPAYRTTIARLRYGRSRVACMHSTFSKAAPYKTGSPQVSRCLWR